ncbi:MAG: hypothetical protein ACE5MI_02845 [Acidimicrobiia bacterium]
MRRALGLALAVCLAACATGDRVTKDSTIPDSALTEPASEQVAVTVRPTTTSTSVVEPSEAIVPSGDELAPLEEELSRLLAELEGSLAELDEALSEDEGDI